MENSQVEVNVGMMSLALEAAGIKSYQAPECSSPPDVSYMELSRQLASLVIKPIVQAEKKARHLDRQWFAANLRARYHAKNVFRFYRLVEKDQEGQVVQDRYRWEFLRSIRGQSLLEELAARYQEHPICLLQADEERHLIETDGNHTRDLPWEQVRNWNAAGYQVVNSKVAIQVKSRIFTELTEVFPSAVDFQAYVPGLASATITNGLWLEQPAVLRTVPNQDGGSMGSDGSGRIHPELLKARIGRVCPVQIRCLDLSSNLFCKGILIPDVRCVDQDGAPGIWIDWSQVKGARKAWAAESKAAGLQIPVKLDTGLIQAWSRPGKLDWSFEVLENLEMNDRTRFLVDQLQDQAFQDLAEKGLDAIVAKMSRDSEPLQIAVKFLERIHDLTGNRISPFSLQQFSTMLGQALGKHLWLLAQGAGQESRRFVCCLDASLEPGTCVVGGRPVGSSVASFRVPLVLAQGLRILKVAAPSVHHCWDGDVIPETVFMHPADLVIGQQGDDDGDIVAIDGRPEVVELFQHRLDNTGPYGIEPVGRKIDLKSADVENPDVGKHLAWDQRGEVGKLTNVRSCFLAAGKLNWARATSVLIQEAIDRRKRIPDWSDIVMLARESNRGLEHWEPRDGVLYPCANTHAAAVDGKGHVDMKQVYGILYRVLKLQAGSRATPEYLDWRTCSGSEKSIEPNAWKPAYVPESGGNLVHYCFNRAQELFQPLKGDLELPNPIDLTWIPAALLKLQGHGDPTEGLQDMSWDQYCSAGGVRERLQIKDLVRTYQVNREREADDRRFAIQLAEERLQDRIATGLAAGTITLQDLLVCWQQEHRFCRHQDATNPGNSKWGYLALMGRASPFPAMIGIQAEQMCGYLNQGNRMNGLVKVAMAAQDPVGSLTGFLESGLKFRTKDGQTDHMSTTGIEAWECQDCQDRLLRQIIEGIRKNRDQPVHERDRKLNSLLNGTSK